MDVTEGYVIPGASGGVHHGAFGGVHNHRLQAVVPGRHQLFDLLGLNVILIVHDRPSR